MKKMALDIDMLKVTTFTPVEHVPEPYWAAQAVSIERCSFTCDPSCMAPCAGTLPGYQDTCQIACWD